MPRTYANQLAIRAAKYGALPLPALSANYRGMWLCTYTSAWRTLIDRARTLGYVEYNALSVKGFSHMLDDLAALNMELIDLRPTWLKDPPYQDHFLGTGSLMGLRIKPKPNTILYLAQWAHDHHILPKRNHGHLTAHAGITIHLMGRGYVSPAEWIVYNGRHHYHDPNANISDSYTRTRSLSSPAASY